MDLPPSVVSAMQRGQKLEAIKLLREHQRIGLKVAKEIIDTRMDLNEAYRHMGMGSRGEKGNSGNGLRLVFAVIGALFVYFLYVNFK
jgi:hypothetical protein